MPITSIDIEFLQSADGQDLLQRLTTEDLSDSNTLKLVMTLRQSYAPEQVNAGLMQARLRVKAVSKFGDLASQMFFTDSALQQASDLRIRSYRVDVLESAITGSAILDVGCGIGADSLAFASNANRVMGLDIDPLRIAIATHNARVCGYDNLAFDIADVTEGIPADYNVVFFDPARRDESGRRIFDVNRYIPPLSLIRSWQASYIIVKLSPGVDVSQLESYEGGVEFISVDGDLKEAVLWQGGGWHGYKATLIRDNAIYHWMRDEMPDIPIREPSGWLVEPDPSIIRSGLVQDVAQVFDGAMLDETIAYFTTDTRPDSVWVRSWQILDWMPFNLKRLKAYLREHNVGQLTIKKRGSPITPEVLLKKLKLKGGEPRVLVLTRYRSLPIVLICTSNHAIS